ncbi:MAG: hypothetical protein NVS2B7_29800 [Herpetosiphon sp.]
MHEDALYGMITPLARDSICAAWYDFGAMACSAVVSEDEMTVVPMDSEKLRYMRFDVQGLDAVADDVLVVLPYNHRRRTEIVITTDEFSAVCPWSGLPDFADVKVRYLPASTFLELKSFKYYLTSFRNVGIFQEDANNRIIGDLVRVLNPLWMEVSLHYKVRGGLKTETRNLFRRPTIEETYDLSGEQSEWSQDFVDWKAWRDQQDATC